MRKFFLVIIPVILSSAISAQRKTENLIIVTLDGMRWQEVFGGIDSALLYNQKFSKDTAELKRKFWSDDIYERRKKLFPFLWNTVATHGQLFGNRNLGSFANVTNPYWFSYPGYNEIFTGYPDTSINSNEKKLNPNENVLEFIGKQNIYKGKVAAFTSWDVFPYILNKPRSGIYINSNTDTIKFNNAQMQLINDMQFLSAMPLGLRLDLLTFFAAREYLKIYKPKVLYIAFDETDDYAHEGQYDEYLNSAHAEDNMIKNLWSIVQNMPEYKNKTTLLITCDHGRGDKTKEEWTSHGDKIAGACEIWIAVMGPDIKPLGEIKSGQVYQRQLATTIAALLGLNFTPKHEVMPPIKTIVDKQ